MRVRVVCSCGKIVSLRNDGTMLAHRPKGPTRPGQMRWCDGSGQPGSPVPTVDSKPDRDDRSLVLQMAAAIASGWAAGDADGFDEQTTARLAVSLSLAIVREYDEGA